MIHDTQTGKTKKPKKGECLICNAENPTKHTTLGASFCEDCWKALENEEELEKRIKWD